MARIKKPGLDYFPLSTNFLDNRAVRRIAKYEGDESATILILLLCSIYGGKGYYIKVDQDLYEDLADKLYTKYADYVQRVVERALEYGLFDMAMYREHGVLTSLDIQQQYILSTRKRKKLLMDPAYRIAPEDEKPAPPKEEILKEETLKEETSKKEAEKEIETEKLPTDQQDASTEIVQSERYTNGTFGAEKRTFGTESAHLCTKNTQKQHFGTHSIAQNSIAKHSTAQNKEKLLLLNSSSVGGDSGEADLRSAEGGKEEKFCCYEEATTNVEAREDASTCLEQPELTMRQKLCLNPHPQAKRHSQAKQYLHAERHPQTKQHPYVKQHLQTKRHPQAAHHPQAKRRNPVVALKETIRRQPILSMRMWFSSA